MFRILKLFILLVTFSCAFSASTNSSSTDKSKAHAQEKISNSSSSSQSGWQYYLDNSWPHKSVSDLKVFGSSITIGKDGNILLLHRGYQGPQKKPALIAENTVSVIDRSTGKIIREWGSNKFLKPHGLFVSNNGDIFITDTVMHQVFKFQVNTTTKLWNDKPSFTLGEPYVSGDDVNHVCGPSDVVEIPETGEFFVSDGYCHSRVMKFDKTGKFLLQFGAGSVHPSVKPTPFNVTHAIALARRNTLQSQLEKNKTDQHHEEMPRKADSVQMMVLVADRNNGRIHSFDVNGTFLYEISSDTFGTGDRWIFSMATTNLKPEKPNFPNYEFGQLYVTDGKLSVGHAKIFILGLNRNNFTVITSFATSANNPTTTTAPKSASSAHNTTTTTKAKADVPHPHDIAVSKDGNEIYVVEAVGDLVIKRFLKGEGPKTSKIKGKGSANKGEEAGGFLVILLNALIHLYYLN